MRIRPVEKTLMLWLKARKSVDRRKTDIKDFSPDRVKNILVVSSTAIGDTLLSTPAIRAVRKRYPQARLIALFNRENIELFSNNPRIDGAVPYYGGYRRFNSTVSALEKYSFDLALIFHGNEPQATPICYLAGARFIMKLPNNSDYNFLLSNRDPVVTWDEMGHGIEGRLKTASLAGCAPDGVEMELFTERADEEKAREFLKKEGVSSDTLLIGLQPGASTVSRQWFPERFMRLGKDLLQERPDARIVLTGSPGEATLCKKIADGIGAGTIVAAGRLPLRQVPPLIKRLGVFVTGDTGPMHIAIAVGTPVVALYAVADSKKSGPLYDKSRHRVIQKGRTCDPCVSKKCEYQKCMEAISVEEVEAAVNDLFKARGKDA